MARRPPDMEILPPPKRENLPARIPLSPVDLPARVDPGDLFFRPLVRFDARSQALTYRAIAEAKAAEAEATQADADLHRSRTERAVACAEYGELPERLAQERYARRLRRSQEIRELQHEIALTEIDHQVKVTRRSGDLMNAFTDLTLARANCTAARHRLLEATQAYLSQSQYGGQHYDLMWERKIGEETLYVEEQRALLQEHRERAGLADRTGTRFHAQRVDMSPAGVETTSVDAEVTKVRRPWR